MGCHGISVTHFGNTMRAHWQYARALPYKLLWNGHDTLWQCHDGPSQYNGIDMVHHEGFMTMLRRAIEGQGNAMVAHDNAMTIP